MSRPRERGQAAVELLAAIPIVIVAGLLAWQLVAVLAGGLRAQERVRAETLHATGAPGETVVVSASAGVAQLLPGVAGLRIRARAGVRVP